MDDALVAGELAEAGAAAEGFEHLEEDLGVGALSESLEERYVRRGGRRTLQGRQEERREGITITIAIACIVRPAWRFCRARRTVHFCWIGGSVGLCPF